MAQFSKAMFRGLLQNAKRTPEDFLRHSLLRRAAHFCFWFLLVGLLTVPASGVISPPDCRVDRILIKPKPGVSPADLAEFHSAQNATVRQTFVGFGGIQVVQLPEDTTVDEFLDAYRESGLVEFAEPDYFVHAAA